MLWHRSDGGLDKIPVEVVPIDSLLPADSPRTAGENYEHAQVLAESDAILPPIVVHRPSMRIIDGMHRWRAAVLRGQREIRAQFFEGDEKDAFVIAVEVNVSHGLPLSLADRTVAAARIIGSHPQWSDRVIAEATGLAAKTVGAIRRRSTEEVPQSTIRVGRDGRVRPLSSAEGRRRAGELMMINPDAPIREIARQAGVAPSTARDVRDRLRAGQDPVPPRQRGFERPSAERRQDRSGDRITWPERPVDQLSVLRTLRKDPSLRFSEAGRMLLRWLDAHINGMTEWERVAATVPAHCSGTVAELAYANAKVWRELAVRLERRGDAVHADVDEA
ncbi:ParB/RepB/Spo0J family partition protein [Amycolatopsis alba]|uniref:Streptomycin biosynthesis protein n=1 Tax=Amycolatopsis alba DSM 44262 TaxID=1125972 RepID=A0A229RFE7_AMYAL|nr:ParB N-terminal domain-containing protein [Amycolatopsis alba]OXM45181.1 streptomycin biosynthesis protein [Amycolatopsis alba DSM 44262]